MRLPNNAKQEIRYVQRQWECNLRWIFGCILRHFVCYMCVFLTISSLCTWWYYRNKNSTEHQYIKHLTAHHPASILLLKTIQNFKGTCELKPFRYLFKCGLKSILCKFSWMVPKMMEFTVTELSLCRINHISLTSLQWAGGSCSNESVVDLFIHCLSWHMSAFRGHWKKRQKHRASLVKEIITGRLL